MAAILVVDGREYVGLNSYKTHPLQARFSKHNQAIHQHAEIAAVVRAKDRRLSSAKLYVARVDKAGNPALAKPCLGCFRMIEAFGIRNIKWT
jgi:Cytidine and deoxycytidylate deaminase zinc-binding region